MALGITIRAGAAHNSITTADGTFVDLSKLTKPEQNKVRRIVVGIFTNHLEDTKGTV